MDAPPASTFISSLIGHTAIPENGTLSRVVFDNDEVRVVVFAMDAGEERSEHAATVPAIVQAISGRLRITVDDVEHEIVPGSWVHVEARVDHSIAALEPSVMLLTLLRGT
jgi:quercetin dioxygenase-like cupin family protein